jgi:transcription elongation factor
VPYTGLAMLHGSKSSAETVFNAEQSKKLYNLINANTTESLLSKIFKKSADTVAKNSNYSGSPNISLSINSPINITGGADKSTMAELDKYSEKLANKITQQITSAFSIRGKAIKPSFNSL